MKQNGLVKLMAAFALALVMALGAAPWAAVSARAEGAIALTDGA